MRIRGAAAAVAGLMAMAGLVAATPAQAATGTTVKPALAHGTGLGFDAASATRPSLERAWTVSPYRTVNIYFSGIGRLDPNQVELTPDWVKTVLSNGWSLIPTVVDRQAPCYGGTKPRMSSVVSTARSQAIQAASKAHSDLVALGLGGTIAY